MSKALLDPAVWPGRSPRALAVMAASLFVALGAAAPAKADYCIRLSGGSFSGDIGFFRIAGARPSIANSMKAFAGRAAGPSPVFGSVIVNKEGTTAEMGASFFIDASQGQFDISFSPPLGLTGDGYASYGTYNVGTHVAAKIVRCSGEP